MKKNVALLMIVSIIVMGFTVLTNDCIQLIFFKEGTTTTVTSYDDDGKITGTTKTLYSKVEKSPSGVSVSVNQQNFDKKGKLTTQSDFFIKCREGILYFDMKMMLPQQQAQAYKDFEMSVQGADKEIPSNLAVGNKLKDAEIKFSFKSKDGVTLPMMNMEIKISNRKVEAKENITTPAGTFECYKITEDVVMKSMGAYKVKSVSWFSFEVGTVRSESYKENGKFTGKTEITEIKKP